MPGAVFKGASEALDAVKAQPLGMRHQSGICGAAAPRRCHSRLHRGVLHLPVRRSRRNVNLFLRVT